MSLDETYLCLVQTGYQKSRGKRRPGQLVKAYVCFHTGGEEAIEWSTNPENGKWLTDRSHVDMGWFMSKRFISEGDSIRFEIFTGNHGQGEDPNLTQQRLYLFNQEAPVREFVVAHVGFNRLPLLKGRFHEVSLVTKRDDIEREISELIDTEDDM
jgi:hypothetical protein